MSAGRRDEDLYDDERDYDERDERDYDDERDVVREDDHRDTYDTGDREPREASRRGRAARRMSAGAVAEAALDEITTIIRKSVEGVTSVRPSGDGWTVGVELLEARRVPSSSDTLALYEVELDADGALTSYRRVRRYARGRGDDAEVS